MLRSTLVWMILAAASMAAKPNFSGDWSMNPEKSNFGPLAANAPQKIMRNIRHAEPAIEFKTVQTGAQVEVTTELKYTTDGKESVNTLRGTEIKGHAKWAGDALVIETRRMTQGVEVTQSDQWTMEDGGRSMKVESSVTTPKGSFQFTVVFDKQQTGEKKTK